MIEQASVVFTEGDLPLHQEETSELRPSPKHLALDNRTPSAFEAVYNGSQRRFTPSTLWSRTEKYFGLQSPTAAVHQPNLRRIIGDIEPSRLNFPFQYTSGELYPGFTTFDWYTPSRKGKRIKKSIGKLHPKRTVGNCSPSRLHNDHASSRSA